MIEIRPDYAKGKCILRFGFRRAGDVSLPVGALRLLEHAP
jgi:hypothetical protein